MRRRDFMTALAAVSALPAVGRAGGSIEATVLARARALAAKPYAPPQPLPADFPKMGYDDYRRIDFREDRAVWRDEGLPFRLQMFHRGGLYRDPVEMFEVVEGAARPIAYSPDLFDFGGAPPAGLTPSLGFAGFRIHTPLNAPGRFDEAAVFLGASYFRALAKGSAFGLSARGLALGAGDADEEFPAFRAFYVERPARGASAIVIHALLDGPSVAGAWRFVITPGEATVIEVAATIIPRVPLARAGLAPLTSMYLFGPGEPRRFDDFRPQVHDSDGLLVIDGAGGRSWRPLSNPRLAQASAFLPQGLQGFGLLQRERDFAAYQDLEALYQARPSAWAEPLSGFPAGDVRLTELPALGEGEDNIVACWRPAQPLAAGAEHRVAYRLRWGPQASPPTPLAQAARWSAGQGDRVGRRRFVVDFAPVAAGEASALSGVVSASQGSILNVAVQPNAYGGGARLSFEFDPGGAPVADLRAALVQGAKAVSEDWVYRWLA